MSTCHVLVIGSKAAGKSCLIHTFLNGEFKQVNYIVTGGAAPHLPSPPKKNQDIQEVGVEVEVEGYWR